MIARLKIIYIVPAILLCVQLCGRAWQQASASPSPQVRDAMADLQRGDFQTAEKKLRADLAAHPGNAWTLSLLGAALDSLQKTAEADPFHLRAVAAAPRSPEVLNNYAAHLWLSGDKRRATGIYRPGKERTGGSALSRPHSQRPT
jgi:Flp pilus assembly protein TadD